MAKPANNTMFNAVWARIIEHEGEVFYTKLRLEFVYTITGDIFRTNRTDYDIARSDFNTVFNLWPVHGPGAANQLVRGPSYIWGVLNDRRILF